MARATVFASSWWGEAWVDALESSAKLDPNRLGRGRSYARKGSVVALMFDPGRVRARVLGNHGRTYQTEIEVRVVADSAWDGVADALAAKSAHVAALADASLDPAIVTDVRCAGVELLPGPGDLRPHCSCPDWAEPCKHAAAVCYLVAAELDRDPYLLFLLRGLPRESLVTMLAERRAGGERQTGDVRGVVASEAWKGSSLDDLGPVSLPQRLARSAAAPRRPGRPLPWELAAASSERIDPRRVDELAADAADRAWRMLTDGDASGLSAGPRADLARRAVAASHPRDVAALAARCRLAPATLAAWAEAWQIGGDDAVDVVADPDSWSIDQDRLAAGRDQLVELGIQRRSVALNYDSLGMPKGNKIVIGSDGRWYHLRAKASPRGGQDQFHLVAAPSSDITDVVEVPSI
ncbi:MAG: SWIM zinc finger family protein [Microthrixaceae bacterium]|nr:SWIM zinc finger family protein [Microthrixaceae bacterium]